MMRSQTSGPFAPEGGRILKLGRNCWQMAHANRAALLVDAADYFSALDAALRRAERSIVVMGWDFDASIRLRVREASQSSMLGDFLRSLVDERPELEVRILIWNLSTVHAPGATLPLIFGSPWQDHPRIKLRLDSKHPIYGAQHQKLVCVDDSIAFVGGIDLTIRRWDTTEHRPDDPNRVDTEGKSYGPVHDLQMVIEGEAAKAAARLAYDRWEIVTGEAVAEKTALHDIWPTDVEPDFYGNLVAVARTTPRSGIRRGVREVAALNADALRAAKHAIYIEAQYFADRRIGRLLAKSLNRAEGPEIVVVIAPSAHGHLEAWIMNGNRDRVLRLLKRADRYGRLRILFPVVAAPDGDQEIFVHAKLVVVDDRFIRVGSSNLNRRSTGLDAECDLAIEAEDQETRARIAAIRARLLGEHLGQPAQHVAATIAAEGSLIKTIDKLSGNGRTLRPYASVTRMGSTRLMLGTRLLDPRRPLRLSKFFAGLFSQLRGWSHLVRRWSSANAKKTAPNASGTR